MKTKLMILLLAIGLAGTLIAQNSDGVALLTGPAAELECSDGEPDVFEPGVWLFSDRDYNARDVPDALSGFKFIRGSIEGVRAVCRQPGVVYVLTPTLGRNPDSREEALAGLGFQKVSLPECQLFGNESNLCSIYQKQVVAGESLAFGKWVVLVVPQKFSKKHSQYDSGEPAEVEMLGEYECDTFQPGVKVFTDREYTVLESPDCLNGQAIVRGSLAGISFRCTKAGVVTLLTPDPTIPQAASLANALEARGFKRVEEDLFQLFGASVIDRVRIYQKRLEAGQECGLGRWAVLLGPKKVTTGQRPLGAPDAKPAEVMPVLNFSPGPEYADSARMFQGIPGIECAANGRLWATWYGGGVTENEHNYILLHTSGDDGKTWERVLILDPDGAGPVRAFDPCLWHDPAGKLWLTWVQSAPGQAPCLLGITTADSGNATTNWSVPRKLCDGVMMNKPTVAADGRWLLPAAKWFSNGSSRVVVSSDQGSTFTDLGAANIPEAKQRSADEHMIVERKDGTLWMLARTGYGLGESVSTDGGKTWPDMAASSIPHTVSRFFIRRLASGRLLLVRHDPPNLGKDPALLTGKGRSHLTAFLSDDEGRTWNGGLLLEGLHGVTYPDGVQAADGSIYVIYDFHRQTVKKIEMAVFTEADVLAGKLVSPNSRLRVLVNQATGINSAVSPAPVAPARNANTDGVALISAPAAGLECGDGETASLEPGVKLFSNRDYLAEEVSEVLRGFKFIRGSIDRVRAVCRQAGMVYVVTPSPGRNPDSRAAALLERGFQKVNLPEFMMFFGNQNLSSVYQKQVAVDEVLDFGKWAVLVLPGKAR